MSVLYSAANIKKANLMLSIEKEREEKSICKLLHIFMMEL